MSIKIESANPKTQSIESVKALLAWKGRAVDPLPATVEFMNHGDESRLVLVLANKKDAYYTCTARGCSCPSAAYRPGQRCKHQRKFFPVETTPRPVESGSIRPNVGSFKPFSEMPSEERAAPIYVDTLPDTTPREVAYHSIKADREMWPAEA